MKRNKKKVLIFALIIAFSATGHSFAKTHRPWVSFRKKNEKELPAKIYEKMRYVKTRSSGGLTLDECIQIAVENHMPLVIAKKQMELAKFRVFEAMRKLAPAVTFKWEESYGKVSNKYYDGTKILFEGKQPVFYGGENIFAIKQARTNLEIVKNDYDRIKSELILQIRKAYYSMDKAKKAFRVQQKLKDGTDKFYNIAKSGYNAEVIPQLEFLEVTSQYNQVNFQMMSAKEDIEVANLILQQAMDVGYDVDTIELEKPKIIDLDLENCFTLAILHRPEIKISKLSITYFGYEKKIMQARANWPRVDLLGMYGNTREDYTRDEFENYKNPDGPTPPDWAEGKNPRWLAPEFYFGIKVSMPFFGSTTNWSYMNEDWQPVVQTYHGTQSTTSILSVGILDKLEDISGAKEADLEETRAYEELRKKREEVALEVKETYFKYKKSVILMDVAQSKVDFQEKQVAVLDIRRELGEAQYSDVLEEMIKLGEEEFSYIQAIADYYIAIATLNKAIGMDWYFDVDAEKEQ